MKMWQIFQSLDYNVNKENVDAGHWLNKKESYLKVLLKDYEKVLKAKNKLRKLDTTNLDLLERSKIFVSQSLCSYYRLLWSTSKKLYGTRRNFSWYVSNGSIKIKLWENS